MGSMAEDSPRLRSTACRDTIDHDSSTTDVCATMMGHGYISGRRRVIRPAGTVLRPYQDELIPSVGPSAANVASMFTDCEALLLDAPGKAASCQFLAEDDKTAQNFVPSDCRGARDGSKTMSTTSWGPRTPVLCPVASGRTDPSVRAKSPAREGG